MISSKALARKIFVPFLATLMVAGLSAGFASPAKAEGATKQVIFHYQDPAATSFDDYKNLDFYFWGGANGDFAPNGSDDFGKVLTLTVDEATTTMAGLIKYGWIGNWSNKVGCTDCAGYSNDADRSYTLNATGTTELWIVKGVNTAAFSSRADAVAAGALNTHSAWAAGDVDPNFDCVNGVCEPAISMPATQTVTIHYNRPDATGFDSYKNWQIYRFNGGDTWFNGSDSFGKVFTTTLTNASKTTTYGFIIKTPTWTKDGCANCSGMGNGDRIINLDADGSTEVWVVSGADSQYFTSASDAAAAGAVASPWAAGATDPNFVCADGVCAPPPSYPVTQTIKIHFNRINGNYGDPLKGWNIWMWGTNTSLDNRTVNFTGSDSYGKVAVLDVPGDDDSQIGAFGFLLRSTDDWGTAEKNHPSDSSVVIKSTEQGNTGVTEIWVKQGDNTVYTSNPYGVPTVSSAGLPASIGYGKTFAISGTNFPTDGNLRVSLVKPAVAAVTATKVGNVWKCGSVTRTQGYVCSAAVPAVTAPAVARAVSATSAVVSLPQVATGFTGKLVVTTPGGTATTTGSVGLTTVKNIVALPVASPAAGVVGDTVTVTATNAGAATSVKLGTQEVPFTVTAINKLTFVVPAGAADGKISITSAAGTSISSASFALKPSITSVSPASAAINGDITITGVNLSTVTGAKIGTKALVIKSKGATSIVATVPTGSVTGKVSVTSPGGTVLSASDLTILPVPTISSITGTKGTGSFANAFIASTTITINGTGLTGATAVRFGAFTVSNFTVVSSTKITFAAPSGKTGTAISVVTPGGTAVKNGAVSTTS